MRERSQEGRAPSIITSGALGERPTSKFPSFLKPMNLPILDVDPYSPALLLAPYDYYRQVRELGPVVRIDRYDVCAVARIDLVEQVFRDWKTFHS